MRERAGLHVPLATHHYRIRLARDHRFAVPGRNRGAERTARARARRPPEHPGAPFSTTITVRAYSGATIMVTGRGCQAQ